MSFLEGLLSENRSSGVRPELLETIGNQAALNYLQSGTPLNDAIVEAVKDHGELNNEHVKRIVEFANNRAFKELFESSDDKNVHFPVADPGVILRDLKDGGSSAFAGKPLDTPTSDYSSPPNGMEKSEFMDPNSAMQQLFKQDDHSGEFGQGPAVEKVASAGLDPSYRGHANPIDDVYEAHVRLKGVEGHLLQADHQLHEMMKTAQEEMYQQVRAQVMASNGLGVGGVVSYLTKLGHDKELVVPVVQTAAERLVRDGVNIEKVSMQKIASAQVPNPNHAINHIFSGLVKIAEDILATKKALSDVRSELGRVSGFLREANAF